MRGPGHDEPLSLEDSSIMAIARHNLVPYVSEEVPNLFPILRRKTPLARRLDSKENFYACKIALTLAPTHILRSHGSGAIRSYTFPFAFGGRHQSSFDITVTLTTLKYGWGILFTCPFLVVRRSDLSALFQLLEHCPFFEELAERTVNFLQVRSIFDNDFERVKSPPLHLHVRPTRGRENVLELLRRSKVLKKAHRTQRGLRGFPLMCKNPFMKEAIRFFSE